MDKSVFCRNGVVLAFQSVNDKNKIKAKYLHRGEKKVTLRLAHMRIKYGHNLPFKAEIS